MIVREGVGIDDLGQDWLGPLIASVAQTGLAIYQGVSQARAVKKAKREEEKAAAQEAAAAAQAMLLQQQQVRQMQETQAAGGGSGVPPWVIWTAAAVGGVGLLGIAGYLLLAK